MHDNPEPVMVIPYCLIDGVPTFRDSEVRAFYDRIERDGLKDIVFMHGDIQDRDAFLREMKRPGGSRLYVVAVGELQVGILWLNRFEGKTCRVHFTSFSEAWSMDTVAIGRDAIRQIMYMPNDAGEYVFDVLLGLTPSRNIRALRWLEKVGLELVGVIPASMWDAKAGESVDGTLMYLTRQEV